MKRARERWLIGVLVLMSGAYAVAEELNLVTYFPAPRGVYEELHVRGDTSATSIPTITVSTPGTQTNHEARIDLFTKDTSGRGQVDFGDTFWSITARGDAFNPPEDNDLAIRRHAGDGTETTVFMIDSGIDATGGADNVGIATTDPTQRLTLGSGNILLPNANIGIDGNLYFGGITDLGQNGLRLFGGLVNGTTQGGYVDVRSSDPKSGLHIRSDTGNGGTDRLMITAEGNVGIGTATPDNLLDVDGSVEVGDWLETSQPNNRFRFCGSGTNPASCNTASELIAGRGRLSADGSFANAETRYEPFYSAVPGFFNGSLGAGGNVFVLGQTVVGTTTFDPLFRLDVTGDAVVAGNIFVGTDLNGPGVISAAGDVSAQKVVGRNGLCIHGGCITSWTQPPPPIPPLGSDACTVRNSGGCSTAMVPGRVTPCQSNEYAREWELRIVGGCGDVKQDFGVSALCCVL